MPLVAERSPYQQLIEYTLFGAVAEYFQCPKSYKDTSVIQIQQDAIGLLKVCR